MMANGSGTMMMEEPESKGGERSDDWWENWEKLLKLRMREKWVVYLPGLDGVKRQRCKVEES